MLTTLEVRWFARGQPPTEVEHWFNADCPGELMRTPEEREDLYLYTPRCDYLNIKLRQGSLDVKWRKAQLGVRQFSKCWEGQVEQWLKWTCKDPDSQTMMPAEVMGKGPWISVKKVRLQRQYQAVSYELTQLNVMDDDWWSMGFEAAIEQGEQFESFERVVTQVSQTYRGPELSTEHSYAYPAWLCRVI
ncbi:MAG TPA: hypothetical protein V6D50_06585 [Chroococcales cyanobacterium]|jgi:hypothetical protein